MQLLQSWQVLPSNFFGQLQVKVSPRSLQMPPFLHVSRSHWESPANHGQLRLCNTSLIKIDAKHVYTGCYYIIVHLKWDFLTKDLLSMQVFPFQPLMQSQTKSATRSMQNPPFRQGFGEHSFLSAMRRKLVKIKSAPKHIILCHTRVLVCDWRLTDVAMDAFPALFTYTLVAVDAIYAGSPIQARVGFTVIDIY